MLPHVFPMACCPNGMSLPCHPNSMPPHAALIPCHPMLPHAAPCHPMPSKFHAATSPSADPSILYHSSPPILVLNPIHAPWPTCIQCAINIPLILVLISYTHQPIHLHWVQLTPRPTHLQWLQYTPWAHVGWPCLVCEIIPSAGPSDMDLIH